MADDLHEASLGLARETDAALRCGEVDQVAEVAQLVETLRLRLQDTLTLCSSPVPVRITSTKKEPGGRVLYRVGFMAARGAARVDDAWHDRGWCEEHCDVLLDVFYTRLELVRTWAHALGLFSEESTDIDPERLHTLLARTADPDAFWRERRVRAPVPWVEHTLWQKQLVPRFCERQQSQRAFCELEREDDRATRRWLRQADRIDAQRDTLRARLEGLESGEGFGDELPPSSPTQLEAQTQALRDALRALDA